MIQSFSTCHLNLFVLIEHTCGCSAVNWGLNLSLLIDVIEQKQVAETGRFPPCFFPCRHSHCCCQPPDAMGARHTRPSPTIWPERPHSLPKKTPTIVDTRQRKVLVVMSYNVGHRDGYNGRCRWRCNCSGSVEVSSRSNPTRDTRSRSLPLHQSAISPILSIPSQHASPLAQQWMFLKPMPSWQKDFGEEYTLETSLNLTPTQTPGNI